MKRLVNVVLVLSLTCALFATGSSEENKKAQEKEQPKTVKIWINSGAEEEIYRAMFESARKDLGISIEDEYYPQTELDGKLQLAPVVGDMPDLIIVDYLQLPAYYEAGLLANLDGKIAPDIEKDLLPSVQAEAQYDGHEISVAQFDSGMALWANKAMLEQVGARIPKTYEEAWSKAEFEDILAKLKASGVKYPLYIRQNKPSSMYFMMMPVIASFGGDYLNRNTMLAEGTLDSPETIAAFDYITWLIKKGYVDPTCDYEDPFYGKKESALSLIGHWKYTQHVEGLGDDAIIVPLPDFGHGVYTCSGSTVEAMTTAAKENGVEEAAIKVLEYTLSKEQIKKMVDFNGAIPARKSVMDSIPNLQKGGRLYLYREQLEAGISVLRPVTPAHMTVLDAVTNVLADVIHGADASEELHSAAKSVDEIIRENGWNK